MIRFLRDFKPILDLDLYSDHMPKERITWSKIEGRLINCTVEQQIYLQSNCLQTNILFNTMMFKLYKF